MATAIQKVMKQCTFNLAGLDNTPDDKEYYKVVKRSLTAEQFDAYGEDETSSATLLIQKAIAAVVNKPFAVLQKTC